MRPKSQKEKLMEYLTGILLGLIISLAIFAKIAFAAEEEVIIPKEIEFWCERYGEEYDIAPEILEAVCWVESRCTPDAQSLDKSCKGLMQIKPSCHQERMNRLGVRNIFGTWENIKVGADYLAELSQSEDIAVALTIYNGQSDANVAAARKGEYSAYVKKILAISEDLELSHKK